MWRNVMAGLLGATISVAVACTPERGSRLFAPHRSNTLSETDTTPLSGVNISAIYRVGTANTYDMAAQYTDNSQPVTFRWLAVNCPGNVADYDCGDVQSLVSTDSTHTFTFPQFTKGTRSSVTLEVRQAIPGGRSGYKRIEITTPAYSGARFTSTFVCDLQNNYLFQSEKYDTVANTFAPESVVIPPQQVGAGTKVPRIYRRNPCYGMKEYNYTASP